MSARARRVEIIGTHPRRVTDAALILAARDEQGPLEVFVSLVLWEELQAAAPLPSDAEDRRDHALARIEAMAAYAEPAISAEGLRLILLE